MESPKRTSESVVDTESTSKKQKINQLSLNEDNTESNSNQDNDKIENSTSENNASENINKSNIEDAAQNVVSDIQKSIINNNNNDDEEEDDKDKDKDKDKDNDKEEKTEEVTTNENTTENGNGKEMLKEKEGEKDQINEQVIDPVFGESKEDNTVDISGTKLDMVPVKLVSTNPVEISRIKKLNHKEVERRRRETINNAIRELQELVPTTHTNKAQIIRKASEFIKKLKEKEESLVNKWTLEKIITDQAISELANSNEKLKSELEKAYREIEQRKNVLESFVSLVSKQDNSSEVQEFLEKTSKLIEQEKEDEEVEEEEEEDGEVDTEQQEEAQTHESKEEQASTSEKVNEDKDFQEEPTAENGTREIATNVNNEAN